MTTARAAARTKLVLAARGIDLGAATGAALGLAQPGVEAIGLVLPGDLRVEAPITRAAAPLLLTDEQGRYYVGPRGSAERLEVRPVPPPRFYERRTSRGTPMGRIATVRGSHVLVHPSERCGYSVLGRPCRFCREGARGGTLGDTVATVGEVIEVVRAAFDEGVADLVYFNSGHFESDDGGIAFLTPYIEAVRKHFDTLVATQVHPPRHDQWIDRTYAMGVDALSYNLEIYDAYSLERACIGRARYVGRERYLEALARATEVFPRGTIWSDLVVGLEPFESTIAGIDALTAMGVVPVLSVVPQAAPDPETLEPLLVHLYEAARDRHVHMGWVRDLSVGITPLEARFFTGDGPSSLAAMVHTLTRWRLGALATRQLARFRRRLRVRTVSESFDSAHL